MKDNKEVEMKVIKMPIGKLKEAPYNPNRMKKSIFKKLVKSIRKTKVYSPLFYNERTGHVPGGNHRLRALRELGYTEVYVVVVNMFLEEEMAFNLFLNKNVGEFDPPSLPMIFNALQSDPELLSATGFDMPEIYQIIDAQTVHPVEEFDPEKELTRGEKAVTKPGDIVELGAHKIICGNTTDPETLKRLLGKDVIRLVHMDLPYGCSFDPNNRPHLPRDKNQGSSALPIKNDDLVGSDYLGWLKEVVTAIMPFLSDTAPLYLWSGFVNFGLMTQLLLDLNFHVSNVITWVKPTACPGFGFAYKYASEFLLYAFPKGKGKGCWSGPKNETNVWEIDREDGVSALHPTVKPTALARRVLRNSSQKGDIVFDGVMGVGFNLLACEQMGRIFRGVDCEPLYIDLCVKRYVQAFGMDSVSDDIRNKYFGGIKNVK